MTKLADSVVSFLKSAAPDSFTSNPHYMQAALLPATAGALFGIPALYGAVSSPKGRRLEGVDRAMDIATGTYLGGGLGSLLGAGAGKMLGGSFDSTAAGGIGGLALGGLLGHGLARGLRGSPSWETPDRELKEIAREQPESMAGMAGGDPKKYSDNLNTLGALGLSTGAGALTGATLAHLLAGYLGQGVKYPYVTLGGALGGGALGAGLHSAFGSKFHDVNRDNQDRNKR